MTSEPVRNATKATAVAPSGADRDPRPVQVTAATVALVAGGLFSVLAAASWFRLHRWLVYSITKGHAHDKVPPTTAQVLSAANRFPSSQLTSAVVLLVVLSILAYRLVWRGHYWSRWAVTIVWFLGSFTGTMAGINSVLTVGTSVPNLYKIPAFLAGVLTIAALVLVWLPASTRYFVHGRPVPVDGAVPRRGLFAPRVAPAQAGARTAQGRPNGSSALASSAASRGQAYLERSKSKKRTAANADFVARAEAQAGAKDGGQRRPRTGKSRRIES